MGTVVAIDRSSPVPLTRQIYDFWRAGYICLSHWGPDLNLFPLESWHRLYARSLRTLGADALGYAEYARGYEPLCEEIARYVARSRAVTCSAEQVIVVNGSQQGLDLCARLLLEPGDEVAVENPGYSGASRVFEATLCRFMKEGLLERHIRRMRRTYDLRRTTLVESLHTYFGDRASVLGEAAGMHAYVRFNDPDIATRAARNKVQLRDVGPYYLGKAPANDYLLGFSMLSESSIREGVKRLANSPPQYSPPEPA